MIRALLVFAIAGVAFAADEPAVSAPEPPKIVEAPLTEHQHDVLRATSAELDALKLLYMQQTMPASTEQNGIVAEACTAMGVPEKAISEGQCRVEMDWVDPKTKKKTGRVVWKQSLPDKAKN